MFYLVHNPAYVADSRDIAVMTERDHKELLKTIRQYCSYLGESEIPPSDFFIPSTYPSEQNEELTDQQERDIINTYR